MLNQVEVLCLPKDLPEYIEVDMSEMHINDMKRLSDIKLPEGVQFVALAHGRDEPVVSIHHPRAEEAEAPAAAAAAAAPASGAPAADAKKEEAKKDGGKK